MVKELIELLFTRCRSTPCLSVPKKLYVWKEDDDLILSTLSTSIGMRRYMLRTEIYEMSVCVCVCMCVYVRERKEREGEGGRERKRVCG